MAQRRRVSNTPYIYDNTARDLQIRRQMEEPRRQMSHETRKNREKARHMSIGYVTFLMGALIACATSRRTTFTKCLSCILCGLSGKLYPDAVGADHQDH